MLLFFFLLVFIPSVPLNIGAPKCSDFGLIFQLSLPLVITSAPTASNDTALGITAKCGLLVLTSLVSSEPDFQCLLATLLIPPTPHFKTELKSGCPPGFMFLLMAWSFSQLLRWETLSHLILLSPIFNCNPGPTSFASAVAFPAMPLFLYQCLNLSPIILLLMEKTFKEYLIWIFFSYLSPIHIRIEQSFNLCTLLFLHIFLEKMLWSIA